MLEISSFVQTDSAHRNGARCVWWGIFWLCLINVVLYDGVVPLFLNAPWSSSGGGETPWCCMSFLQVENTVHVCDSHSINTCMYSFQIQTVSHLEKCLTYFWTVLKCVHMPAASSPTTVCEGMFWTSNAFSDLLRLYSIFFWSVSTRTGLSTWTELSANEKRRNHQRASLWQASIRPGQTSLFSLPRAAAGRHTSTHRLTPSVSNKHKDICPSVLVNSFFLIQTTHIRDNPALRTCRPPLKECS